MVAGQGARGREGGRALIMLFAKIATVGRGLLGKLSKMKTAKGQANVLATKL